MSYFSEDPLMADDDISYEVVLAWLSAHGPELTDKQKLALVAPLMSRTKRWELR